MVSLSANCWWSSFKDAYTTPSFLASGKKPFAFWDANQLISAKTSQLRFCIPYRTCCFAKKAVKKSTGDRPSKAEFDQNDMLVDSVGQTSNTTPSRGAVLRACTVTSSLIAALGIVIRQLSHVASVEGLPILDCSTEVSCITLILVPFTFVLRFSTGRVHILAHMWHIELITGLVVSISSCRFLLLKTWPDFAESSEAANKQVLTSLQPLDYMVVAFLPGISEELLFRGALLPLFGVNWKSLGLVALIFGVLHLGSGRKYSFAIWATFVGLVYGYATILSSSIVVPMASHAVNNLIGGVLWRYTSKASQ